MKVGILTLPLLNNYGGILQAAALTHYLETTGHQPTLLNKKFERPKFERLAGQVLRHIPGHDIKNIRSNERERARHYPFLDAHIPARTKPLYTLRELENAARERALDAIIVGSDQVWRPGYMSAADTKVFYLDVDLGCRKIAYAASFGKSQWTRPERIPDVKRMIAGFDAVSVREQSAVELCKDLFGRDDCTIALDPTLLVDPSFYEKMKLPVSPGENYVLNYVLDENASAQDATATITAASGIQKVRLLTLDDGARTATIPEWIMAFRQASYVITDSFHGTVMSVLFRKPFMSIANMERGIDRFQSLLTQLGLMERLVTPDMTTDLSEIAAAPIDFNAVHEKLAALRLASARFLNQALGG